MVKKMMNRAASVPNLSESFTTEILDATSNITSQLRQSMKHEKIFLGNRSKVLPQGACLKKWEFCYTFEKLQDVANEVVEC